MYVVAEVEDVVRIPPSLFGRPLVDAATFVLRQKYEGLVHPDLGIIITVFDVNVKEEGRIIPGDGATYHDARFKVLTFLPVVGEVVEGEVVGVHERGLFVNLGPIDGFIHISQIADDKFNYDPQHGRFIGERTKKIIEKGDIVRARIIAVSIPSEPTQRLRVQLTMRQPFLGKLEWIREEVERIRRRVAEAEAKA